MRWAVLVKLSMYRRLDWRKPRTSGATTFEGLVMARVEQMQTQAAAALEDG
jgi:hypothetical protein